jgi:AraC-like DNA-binding protein
MKPVIYKVPFVSNSSFSTREVRLPYFDATWHFHQEYELVLIVQSKGKRFVGSHISDFEAGNLTFLGPKLPHLFRNEQPYYEPGSALPQAVSIVIQFPEDFLGNSFLLIPEMQAVRQLFEKAMLGLDIYGKTRKTVAERMIQMLQLEGLDRLLSLLSILKIIAHSTEYVTLSKPGISGATLKDTERMNKIYEFVLLNYQKPIILQQVADLVHMSRSAFCRYFKMRTKKTFYLFVSEIRIGHACKLLLEEDLNVTQISMESGFNNLSNFNRQFQAITNMSPLKYKQFYVKQKG